MQILNFQFCQSISECKGLHCPLVSSGSCSRPEQIWSVTWQHGISSVGSISKMFFLCNDKRLEPSRRNKKVRNWCKIPTPTANSYQTSVLWLALIDSLSKPTAPTFRYQERNLQIQSPYLAISVPPKKILDWANVCFSEHEHFMSELAEFQINCKLGELFN